MSRLDYLDFEKELMRFLGDSHESEEMCDDYMRRLYEDYLSFIEKTGLYFTSWVRDFMNLDQSD
jgi:hypothetical protein